MVKSLLKLLKFKNFLLTLQSIKDVGFIATFKKIVFALRQIRTESEYFSNDFLVKLMLNPPKTFQAKGLPFIPDVIIPVYNAYEYVERCLRTVLKNSSKCRIIIVDDASNDGKTRKFLREISLAHKDKILLITNEQNLGFVKSVNKAVKYVKNHFVVLNSDTEVPPEWLERIFYPIVADNKVASVTPFTNAGTLVSFPEMWIDNDLKNLFKGWKIEDIDDYFKTFIDTSELMIQLPTPVGFCTAFNKYVVDKIGMFDETYGRGYAEECDWGMRAYNLGYKNVIAANLFVYHYHCKSFDPKEKNKLVEKHLKYFKKKYPEVNKLLDIYTMEDPLKSLRETLFLKMLIDYLKSTGQKAVLMITYKIPWTTGASFYRETLKKEILNQYTLIEIGYYLSPSEINSKRFRFFIEVNCGQKLFKFSILIHQVEIATAFKRLIEFMSPNFIFVDNLFLFPKVREVAKAIAYSNLPYIYSVHDYISICPFSFLISPAGKFCEYLDVNKCETCIRNPHKDFLVVRDYYRNQYGEELENILLWRKDFEIFLKKAFKIVVFSNTSKKILRMTFPDLNNLEIIEHYVDFSVKSRNNSVETSELKIGIIGNLNLVKGREIVEKIIFYLKRDHLPVKIILIGDVDSSKTIRKNLEIAGKYDRKELESLLNKFGINFVLIPSVWPEAFCFTAEEAMKLGYPVVAFNIGAHAERIKRRNLGLIINEVNAEKLYKIIKDISLGYLHFPKPNPNFIDDFVKKREWRKKYLEILEKLEA